MELISGITTHTIVLVVEKPEKSVSMTTLLQKMGYKTFISGSLYEALRVIDQEMPHLVISESILTDGTVGTLYDRLQQHEILSATPILALVASKTKEHLTPLQGRSLAGFLLGKFDPAAFSKKVKEIFTNNHNASPYFVSSNKCELEANMTISIQARALGRAGDQVVYSSESEVDTAAALVCLPQESGKGPALLKMGTNAKKDGETYNYFPLSRIRGKGRVWIESLPEIDLAPTPVSDKVRVLFYDPNAARFEQFKEVLSGYGLDLMHADSLGSAASYLSRDPGAFDCIYLDELGSGNSAIKFKEELAKVPEGNRPAVIVGTSSMNAKSTNDIRYIVKPFGLGVLVETFDMASKVRQDVSGEVASVDVSYQAPGKILGLDETGGIIQLKFPMVKGSRVSLEHDYIRELWEGETSVDIVEVGCLPDKPDIWQAKFVCSKAKGNKAKYWEKIQKSLQDIMHDNEEKSA